jgi:hypothetical protein
MTSQTFTIVPRGPFSLAEAAAFGFGQRDASGPDDVMRLAFCLDLRSIGVGTPGPAPSWHRAPGQRASSELSGSGCACCR